MTETAQNSSIVIVLTDIPGINEVYERDVQKAKQLLKEQREFINPFLEEHEGTMFIAGNLETMLMFSNVEDALQCAIDIQKDAGRNSELTLRMGLHLEDTSVGQGRISENGVKVASEILSYSSPGGISLSENVWRHLGDEKKRNISSAGRRQLQWTESPVEVYEMNIKQRKPHNTGFIAVVKDLWERRVPQILGIYLGASWAIIEFISSLLVDRYQFSPELITITLFALLLMIPTVLMIAYFHGRPGPDQWTRFEKIGIPINLIVTLSIILLVVFF